LDCISSFPNIHEGSRTHHPASIVNTKSSMLIVHQILSSLRTKFCGPVARKVSGTFAVSERNSQAYSNHPSHHVHGTYREISYTTNKWGEYTPHRVLEAFWAETYRQKNRRGRHSRVEAVPSSGETDGLIVSAFFIITASECDIV
jgi:hypothetical protein